MLLKEFHEPSHVLKLVIAVVVAAAAVAVSHVELETKVHPTVCNHGEGPY